MIVLVDTSVWIRFLSNRAPYAAEMDELLSRDEVSGHDFVYGELLMADKGGRRQLVASYEQMHQAPMVPTAKLLCLCASVSCTGAGLAGSMRTFSSPR